MSSFWDTLSDNLFKPTPEQTLTPPVNEIYKNLVLNPELIDAAIKVVFPPLSPDPNSPNSLIARSGKPDGFDTPPADLSPEIFTSWVPSYQEEYINANKGDVNFDPATGVLEIGTTTGQPIHVTLSSAQDKVYVLETLQVTDFAIMTKADQQRIAQTKTFTDQLAPQFGLSTDYDTTSLPSATSPGSLYQQTLADINNFDISTIDPKIFSDADKQVFRDELTNIQKRLDTQGVFVATQINAAINDIKKRFDTVAAFATATATPETPVQTLASGVVTQWKDVISLDGGATIRSGIQNFMAAEKQILEASSATLQLASPVTHLDVPTLLAAFEVNANLKLQGEAAFNTEIIKQVNAYVDTINLMLQLANDTSKVFDVTKSDEKRGLLGWDNHSDIPNNTFNAPTTAVPDPPDHASIERLFIGSDIDGTLIDSGTDSGDRNIHAPALTVEQGKVISMFENNLGGDPTSAKNPIEVLFGIQRPTNNDFYDNEHGTLNYFEKSFWDTLASNLNQVSQQANEHTQLTFNDISTENKELADQQSNATDALAKLAELDARIVGDMG